MKTCDFANYGPISKKIIICYTYDIIMKFTVSIRMKEYVRMSEVRMKCRLID